MAVNVKMKNTHTGMIKDVPAGFSWTSLFFSFLVPIFRGDIKVFFLLFIGHIVLILVTLPIGGFGNIVILLWQAFAYNKYYIGKLSERGYAPADDNSREIILDKHAIEFK